jgi:hypothetical protein
MLHIVFLLVPLIMEHFTFTIITTKLNITNISLTHASYATFVIMFL